MEKKLQDGLCSEKRGYKRDGKGETGREYAE